MLLFRSEWAMPLVVLAAGDARDRAADFGRSFLSFGAGQSLARGGFHQRRALLVVLLVAIVVLLRPRPWPLGLGLGGDVLEGELLVVALAGRPAPSPCRRLQLAEQHLVGERPLELLLDQARHRPRAERLVVAVLGEPVARPPR